MPKVRLPNVLATWPPANEACHHLVDLAEWVRLAEARRAGSVTLRLPMPRSRLEFSSRAPKPADSLFGAYGLCGFSTESLL